MLKDQKLVPNPMVLSKPMPDGAVLVDTESGNCFELNHTGADIWERVSRAEDPTTIADALAEKYGIERSALLADIESLVGDLARNGILIVAR